ncbi:unnamed protein product, partial [Mesorhabditis spiculigera]
MLYRLATTAIFYVLISADIYEYPSSVWDEKTWAKDDLYSTCTLRFTKDWHQRGCAQAVNYTTRNHLDKIFVKVGLTLEDGTFKSMCLRPFVNHIKFYQKVVGELYVVPGLAFPYCRFKYTQKENEGPWLAAFSISPRAVVGPSLGVD